MSLGATTIERELKKLFAESDNHYKQLCYYGYEVYRSSRFQKDMMRHYFHNGPANPEIVGWCMIHLLNMIMRKQLYVALIPINYNCPANKYLYWLDLETKNNDQYSIYSNNSPQDNDGVLILKQDIILRELSLEEEPGELGVGVIKAGTTIGLEAGRNSFGKFIMNLWEQRSLARITYENDHLAIFAIPTDVRSPFTI